MEAPVQYDTYKIGTLTSINWLIMKESHVLLYSCYLADGIMEIMFMSRLIQLQGGILNNAAFYSAGIEK